MIFVKRTCGRDDANGGGNGIPTSSFPKLEPSGELHWELREPSGDLQNPTQMPSCNRMNDQPLHVTNIYFSSAEISSIRSFFSDCPSNFVDRRMGCCEWMARMWSAHKTTFIHNALVTWPREWSNKCKMMTTQPDENGLNLIIRVLCFLCGYYLNAYLYFIWPNESR